MRGGIFKAVASHVIPGNIRSLLGETFMLFRSFFATLLLMISAYAWSSPALSPAELVTTTSARVMSELEARRQEFNANPAALQAFALKEISALIDKERATQMALGAAVRTATPAELSAFGEALTKNLANRYGQALLEFDGRQKVKVVSVSDLPKGRGVKVSTLSTRRNGTEVPVDYMMRDVAGAWKVFDVQIEGFSYAMTLRGLFAEDLRTQSVGQVAAALEAKTAAALPAGKKSR